MGAAYYDAESTVLFVMNDVAEGGDFAVLDQSKTQAEPLFYASVTVK